MRERERFGDILERKLAPPASPASPHRTRPVAPPLFSFAGGPTTFPGSAARPGAGFAFGVYGVEGPRPAGPPRAGSRLSPAERRAAEELRRLGGISLADDFSTADVKHAYRVLARRFHPDAHPHATDAERSYLAHTFSRITAAYHELTSPGQ